MEASQQRTQAIYIQYTAKDTSNIMFNILFFNNETIQINTAKKLS